QSADRGLRRVGGPLQREAARRRLQRRWQSRHRPHRPRGMDHAARGLLAVTVRSRNNMTVNDCCRTRVARNRETTTPRNQKVFFVFSCFRDFVIRHTSRACSGARRVGAATAMIIAVAWISASAHNGSVPAPNNASPMITIDGVKGEAAWGAGTVTVPSPNTCTEFTTNTGTPVQAFGTRDAGNVYLALTIPDTSPSQFDHLLPFFDGNHAAGPALQADDVACDFPFGVTTAPFANQQNYTGTSPTWTQSGACPEAVQAAFQRMAKEVG